ncbi:hypothetical protein QYE76_046778 [Lolium multiflorum]|uniref:Reverse transcriptase Ty1/copia-type domain-containing protein n=1 Tax=Lolium multiflorum TaxID=4521 RepID=A0AAD8TNJ2_LOLMU|nr:hypothetical protein QYE76_046778 [Lolium multiflorum]
MLSLLPLLLMSCPLLMTFPLHGLSVSVVLQLVTLLVSMVSLSFPSRLLIGMPSVILNGSLPWLRRSLRLSALALGILFLHLLVFVLSRQEHGRDYDETFAPVAHMTTVRTLLVVASVRHWSVSQLDVQNAFLNGELSEEVYMQPPPGYSIPDGMEKYIQDLLARAALGDERTVDTPMELNVKLRPTDGDPLPDPTRYRHLVGSLVYLAVTRPDISYPVHILSQNTPPGLEAMLKEFISTQTTFNKSVEEKLNKIDILASKVDSLASDVDLLKSKVMPNRDIENKIVTTANAIQVRINENIRLMAELRARWDREENEKLAKEKNVAKVWTITTTSNANATQVAAPPTITNKRIGVSNVSTSNAKREKLPETAKTAEIACDKTAEIFSNLGDDDPIAVAHNDLDFDDCHLSEVIKFLQKLAKSPNASAINLAFTKHITNALIKAREEKLKLETSIPRKLEDGWEPIIKMKVKDFDCNALCDLGASISVMPKKVYDMLDLPPKNCYLDVNLADNAKKKPLGRVDNVHIMVNNNLVPVDFVVLDIECNASCPIILGRPFLRTVGATIDMKEGNIKYQFPLKKGMEHFPRKRMKLPYDSIIRTNYDVDASSLDVT